MGIDTLKSFETKRVNITLPLSTWEKISEIANQTGASRSEVIRNFVEMFDVCYIGVIETINNCPSDRDLNEWLIENGYGFLFEGKCNVE